ncbi:MAG: hypothetical protein EPO51_23975 [Phenylobacterium sp.]|uniref:hypothetical protein n=1 Tax=Phenylobacterium sp. TaxID=1871053 RepID=UPI001227C9B3|nr:hypothetical protein [Phenylobacterium sp.]TAJ69100.1 MAG: hypothetical protein EPO51_23975 [Phenylobacterium sp.]
MRHAVVIILAAASLAACQRQSADAPQGASTPVAETPTPAQPAASTGAGGAVTGAADPNPAGAGATTDAEPGAPSNRMGSTPASPPN